MAMIIRATNFSRLGKILIIIGLVIFGCNHCSRSSMPALFEAAYSPCEEPKTIIGDNVRTLTVRKDCWSGIIDAGGADYILHVESEPDSRVVSVLCYGEMINFYPEQKTFSCGSHYLLKSYSDDSLRLRIYREPRKKR